MRLRAAILVMFAALCYGFQQTPEGTAERCDNARDTPHKCACGRAMMKCTIPGDTIEEPGKKCSTYCHPEKCFCHGAGCVSKMHHKTQGEQGE
jgi:hypothetical protein